VNNANGNTAGVRISSLIRDAFSNFLMTEQQPEQQRSRYRKHGRKCQHFQAALAHR
jgi:hypothetical protein